MDQNSHPNKRKAEYYHNLITKKGKNQYSIFETIADKILETLDMNVLDFDESRQKEIFINQIRCNNTILRLKRPLKLYIEKFEGGFSIFQKEISLLIFGQTFQQTLKKFQERFFAGYKNNSSLKVNSKTETELEEFYTSLVEKT